MAKQEQHRYKNHRYDELWQEMESDTGNRINEHELNANSIATGTLDRHHFANMLNRMERYTVAGPTEEQTQALLTRLSPFLEQQPQHADQMHVTDVEQVNGHNDQQTYPHNQYAQNIWLRFITLLLQQVPMFSWMFWVASVLVITTGALTLPILGGNINPFFMLLPLVSGFGVFYSLRNYRTPMGELEATFPITPAEIMIGRLGVVLIYNIGFALLASIGLYAFGITDSLLLFIISWLVPLCCCAMFTLVCMLKLGSLSGAILSITVWGVQFVMRDLLGPFYLLSEMYNDYWVASRIIGTMLTLLLLIYVFRLMFRKDKGALSHADPA